MMSRNTTTLPRPLSNLAQRILTALIGVPLVIGAVYAGGSLFLLLVGVLTVAAQIEFYKMSGADERHALRLVGLLMGALVVLQIRVPAAWPALVLLAVGLLVYATFFAGRREVWERLAWVYAGVFYPAFFAAQLAVLRLREGGGVDSLTAFWLMAALLVGIWSNDTLAYVAGRLFGRRPLAPAISPKKTWEGAIGGLVGAMAAVVLIKVYQLPLLNWGHTIALGLIVGVGGEVGDLIESRLKREWGVKDSGNLLPGHGGILDRIDGLLFTAPLYVLYLTYVAGVYR
ncbi:MAG: phosphatidate cytidylyltransferase [Rhodothermales bacterium]